ncbi:MAG TPA: tetratricopeptide repeat protein, partial [Chitinophagaceae bacterium]|nr:tetratricopeptide repeat protein [Chitinophagaceae bacterium]
NESLALHFFERVLQTDPSYLGTYYHLAQLYERLQRVHEAKETYERGIKLATLQKDMHARNELLMALDELE